MCRWLLIGLFGALLVTACGGGSESRATVVAVDLVDGAGEVTYAVGAPPPGNGAGAGAVRAGGTRGAFAAEVAMADGPPIAFVSDRDGWWEIYTMRPDGTDVRQLTLNDASDGAPLGLLMEAESPSPPTAAAVGRSTPCGPMGPTCGN